MRQIRLFLCLLGLLAASVSLPAQTVNWAAMSNQNPHQLRLSAGLEHGTVVTLGYGRALQLWTRPLVLQIDHTLPLGAEPFDDFRSRLGGEVNLLTWGGLRWNGKFYGLYRRYVTDYVRLDNFGADASTQFGYYHRRWMLAAEVGFDKAIVTHFKHRQAYRSQYAGVVDGWYEPDTGGYWYGGLQTALSFPRHDIFLRGGRFINQGFRSSPLLPLYAQLGYRYKW